MNAQAPAPRSIRIAVLAMGGEGGGVLAQWIVDLGERESFVAQLTSVPGVAQRTGATIYYVELFPRSAIPPGSPPPVLALMPMPGDVDVVLCSELMEAGRAIQRGLVTPDRTTLIASTHRVFSMTEKIAMADGRVEAPALLEACGTAARHLVAFDMAALAERSGSVISAVLFGALAGSGALPFPRGSYEETIRHGGVGVEASLRAFALGFAPPEPPPAPLPVPAPVEVPQPGLAGLVAAMDVPEDSRAILREGVLRCADYQDADYARLYLDRLKPILALDRGPLLAETARQLALAMTYEDTIRVAELKIRPGRFARVREEVRLKDGQILEIAEFMHPRTQEIAETLPAAWGEWLLATPWAKGFVDRFTRKGRQVKTSALSGFLLLYAVAAMKPWRRRSLRFRHEDAAIGEWLALVARLAATDAALAAEIAECRGLVKGYGDTNERGRAGYETIVALLPRIEGRADAARIVADLRKAAVSDDTGTALTGAVQGLSLEDAPRLAPTRAAPPLPLPLAGRA